jgi:indole-3-glycerol phosphate synthase
MKVATDIMPAALAILFFPSNAALLYLRILRIIAKKGEEFAKYSTGYIKFFMGILDEILSRKIQKLRDSKARSSIKELRAKIEDVEKPREFKTAVRRPSGKKIKLIAEIKKASPSQGIIRQDFDHRSIARIYEEKGADAVSVLTEEDFFQGNLAFLPQVKKVLTKPVLRKDFIFDEYQIYESRAYEADAILLIASVLDRNQAAEYLDLAGELGLSVLFEVHDFEELETAMMIDSDVIGINNRNLKTLRTDINTSFTLKKEIPSDKIVVSESGIRTREDVQRLENAGFDAMLIGTTFMSAEDIGREIDELMTKTDRM